VTDRSSVASRNIGACDTLLGDANSLENVNTSLLDDGCFCFVQSELLHYELHRSSTQAPAPPLVIAPIAGPGRWVPATGGTQGQQGAQGAQGSRGAQGSQGSGAQGAVGAQGFQGFQGAQGAQGNTGAAGTTGTQGAQGFQGSTGGAQGAQGAQGFQGSGGAQGATGSGAQGATGSQGAQGFQGSGGGAQGAQGNQGAQGGLGAQGSTGAGAQGATGSQGNQGAQGFQGSGAQGAQGGQGFQGAQGRQGATGTGAQGASGAQGSTGAQGNQGGNGAQGASGAAGAQGATGSQGASGTTGAQGAQGAQGSSGASGAQGSQGAQGAQGSGSQGATGVQGFQGAQGAQGSGFQGSQGAQGPGGGAQGAQGAQGQQGAQGAQTSLATAAGLGAYTGDARDGDLTASSGTTVLSHDTFYGTITLSGTASIDTNGYKLACLVFDARNASAGAIQCNGSAGTANTTGGSTAAGGTGRVSTHSLGGSGSGGTGAASVVNGSSGLTGGAGTGVSPSNGGNGGASGASGAGSGSGHASVAGGAATTSRAIAQYVSDLLTYTASSVAYIVGGAGGSGGSSGGAGAGGSDSSGSGAGGGAGGGALYFVAGNIITGSSTPAGVVQARGGAGGAGGAAGGTGAGGSGGAGGGGGGFLYALVGAVTGPLVNSFFDANGGNAGAPGAKSGSGSPGATGIGGNGGTCTAIYLTGSRAYSVINGIAIGANGGTSAMNLTPTPAFVAGQWANLSPSQERFGEIGTEETLSIGWDFAASSPNIMFLCVSSFDFVNFTQPGERGNVYKSTDGGISWVVSGAFSNPDMVKIDPADPNHAYVIDGVRGNTMGFFRTTDGGATWVQPAGFTTLATVVGTPDVYSMSVDPANFNHIILGFHGTWTSGPTGMAVSTDGGTTWSQVAPDAGMSGQGYYSEFLYDPAHSVGTPSTWLFLTQASGMWKTTNAGASWTQVTTHNMAHEGAHVTYFNGYAFVGCFGFLLRSADNGSTWTTVSGLPSGSYITAIPANGKIYAQPNGFVNATPMPFYESSDGVTWVQSGTATFSGGPFAGGYANNALYASMYEGGLWRYQF